MLPVNWRKRSDGLAQTDVPLAPRTSWRIGGTADLFVAPRSPAELAAVLADLWRTGQPWRILGGGSNLLIGDRGVRDVVLQLGELQAISVDGARLRAEAGADLQSVVRAATNAGLTGAEPLAGIPGNVGGAVFGNAGGRYGAIGPLVCELELVCPDGTRQTFVPGQEFFEYRKSAIGERIVVAATLQLSPAPTVDVHDRAKSIFSERAASQPGWIGNAGCVFKNPAGDSAGRLIDSSGGKDMHHGGIVVSPTHANFFENPNLDGTSDDVCHLVDKVRTTVRRHHGVDLEWEVRRWGL